MDDPKTTIKVSAAAASWIRDEQYAERKSTGRQPAQAEIIDRLIQDRNPNPKRPAIPEKLMPAVETFVAWLRREPRGVMETHVRKFILEAIGIKQVPPHP